MTTQTRLITGVDFVSIPTRDLAAARAFYGDVLGLEPSKLWGTEDPLGAEFETGTVTVALIAVEKLGIEFQPNSVPLALHVDDVAEARAALEARGVAFAHDTLDSGVCHMANFRDPEGNALMIHHRYAPPDARPGGGS